MAMIKLCPYCGRRITNRDFCTECRQAYCEELLSEIQKLLKYGEISGLPAGLAKEILSEQFTSMENHLRELKERDRRAVARTLHQQERDQAVREAMKVMERWDKEHPDPYPPTY